VLKLPDELSLLANRLVNKRPTQEKQRKSDTEIYVERKGVTIRKLKKKSAMLHTIYLSPFDKRFQ